MWIHNPVLLGIRQQISINHHVGYIDWYVTSVGPIIRTGRYIASTKNSLFIISVRKSYVTNIELQTIQIFNLQQMTKPEILVWFYKINSYQPYIAIMMIIQKHPPLQEIETHWIQTSRPLQSHSPPTLPHNPTLPRPIQQITSF